MAEKITFSFGENWQRFLKIADGAVIEKAKNSITSFFDIPNLEGKTFLDVGCGSGIFSSAAFQLGAAKVVSFDIDQFSVDCCNYLKSKIGNPPNWTVFNGSILDPSMFGNEKFDVVYAWGVLHHTGRMWQAIKNTSALVAPGGYMYIAIYNKIPGRFGSLMWRKIKKTYNHAPMPLKYVMEWLYISKFCLSNILRLKNPFKKMKNHSAKRGMSWRLDVKDWLGGYPYEFAATDEIFSFVKKTFPDFNLINLKSAQDLGNNWYLFRRNG